MKIFIHFQINGRFLHQFLHFRVRIWKMPSCEPADSHHPLDVAFAIEDEDSKPWRRSASVTSRINAPMPESLTLVLANMIFITKADLPQPLTNRLIRLAAFQNPEFYKAQAMRLPVWNKPRIIGCAENYNQFIGLQEVECCSDTIGRQQHQSKTS